MIFTGDADCRTMHSGADNAFAAQAAWGPAGKDICARRSVGRSASESSSAQIPLDVAEGHRFCFRAITLRKEGKEIIMATRNGTAGNDTLDGSIGGNVDDILNGGLGDDVYPFGPAYFQSGNDIITDTGGMDTIELSGAIGNYDGASVYRSGSDLVIDLGWLGRITVASQFAGAPVVETLRFSLPTPFFSSQFSLSNSLTGTAGSDLLVGTPSAETLSGGDGNDLIFGNEGNDTLQGDDGDDDLSGGAGLDNLVGGAGSDELDGGMGNDTLTGGADSDFFDVWSVFGDTSTDTITDFTAGNGIASDRLWIPTWQFSGYTGGNPFGNGYARLTQSGSNTLLEFDTDGPGGAAAFQTAVILNNVNKSDLVANNLNGYNPNAIVGNRRRGFAERHRW
jgi:Ca2+-binding RTX toxin-like protein